MSDTTRTERIARLLERGTPYRVNPRLIRRVLAEVPIPPARYRPAVERFIAAVVALPYRITP